jgi:heat shock protein HslJ
MSSRAWLATLLACAAWAGCAQRQEVSPVAVPTAVLAGSEWQLLRLDGQPALAGHAITLEFEPARLGGYAGCNWYGATWRPEAGRLRVGGIESSARGCSEDAMAQEARFLAHLRENPAYRFESDRLTLADARGAAAVVFSRRVATVMDPAALLGTRWRLREAGSPARPIRMTIHADRIEGFAGCRPFEADYIAKGDRITIASLRMRELDCAAGAAMLEREGRFTTALSESLHYLLDGDALTLTTWGGQQLVFERER